MSSFAWLDYSEDQRRQMLDVISLFKEKTTRDELGIGTTRDAFANLLFPGTSTIQTRARYFLFIPWIYLALERRRVPSNEINHQARNKEYDLIDALRRSGATEGLIGERAGRKLRRLPSTIYWTGLGRWGIRQFPGDQWQYHQSLDRFYTANRQIEVDNKENELNDPLHHNWHSGLPKAPKGFPQGATFDIPPQEAHYLREQILRHAPDSMLAFLVDRGQPVESVKSPWQHPQFAEFPETVKHQLYHAQNFAEVIHGAALLYNLMLAEKGVHDLSKDWHGLVDDYRQELTEWAQRLSERSDVLANWNWQSGDGLVSSDFWQVVMSGGDTIPARTIHFVNTWLDLALAPGGAESISQNETARELVSRREWHLKGKLARLHSSRALELWLGASGTGMLDYRWGNARTITNDILKGAMG